MNPRISLALALILALPGWAQTVLPLPAAGNVTLPLDEYNRLSTLASQPPPKGEAPPFPHVLKSAQWNLQVGAESVTGNVVLDGEVLAAGDRRVPLVSGMIVLNAQRAGLELAVEQAGGVHSAVLNGPGEFTVTLETAMPLAIETGRASFQLPVPTAGAARLTLVLPGEQTQVNLTPGLITSRTTRDGKTTIEATLSPGMTTNVWWASRLNPVQPPAAPKEVRFLSDVKTLISVTDGELTLAALAELTVVQGEPGQFEVAVPEGYELTGATGPTLISTEERGRTVVLRVENSPSRTHQFLLSLVKPNTAAKVDIPLLTLSGAQRETGEVLVEGEGAMELTATELGGLRRMDLKEASSYLRSLARTTLHAAFRYQKRPSEMPAVGLEWVRFPDSQVLSAVAQRAVVTTMVTSEGRTLTEVKLTLKNQAQPFLKVDLPAGASILSAEVAGEKVKPVQGSDGNRVPLLRAGFRPSGEYNVSYVFLHAGAPFARKGGAELALPKMDIPIGRVEWEVFLPQQYKVADFGGNAVRADLLPLSDRDTAENAALPEYRDATAASLGPGMLGGSVTDPVGAFVTGASITVKNLNSGVMRTATADSAGRWIVTGLDSGRIQVSVRSPGFQTYVREINFDNRRGARLELPLQLGAITEAVVVTAEVPRLETQSSSVSYPLSTKRNASQDLSASANVQELQRRIVGVLPIAVNVPRTGNSYQFVRPLVVDEETNLTFRYRSR